MDYRFKKFQELAWFALVAAITAAITVLVSFDPDAITDWRTWVISLGAGMIRAAAGAVIAAITVPSQAPNTQEAKDAKVVALSEKIADVVEAPVKPKE